MTQAMKSLKIYFAGAIRAGRTDAGLYRKTLEEISQYGQVLTEHVGDSALLEKGEKDLSDREIHDRDIHWIEEADILIAEVTTPSLGVGYEISAAINLGKPVYCLFDASRGTSLSAMIRGSQHVSVFDYSDFKDIQDCLRDLFQEL